MSNTTPNSPMQSDDRSIWHIWAPFLFILLVAGGSMAAVYTYHRLKPEDPRPGNRADSKRDIAQEARDELKRRDFRALSASLESLLADPKYDPIPTQAHSLLLQPAPEFTLKEVDGADWSLKQHLKEGPIVLVFYYGYHCNHCVSQLFALDKDVKKFQELGVQVVAVSADPVETTRERYKQYGAFKFPVLSDPKNRVAEKYKVYTPGKTPGEEGDLLHGTFLIDRQGKIVWTNRGDEPFTENRTLLHEAARIEGKLPKVTEKRTTQGGVLAE